MDMRIPRVPDGLKEAPAQVLRTAFAGIGQLLLMADRIRNPPPGPERTALAAAALPVPNYDQLSLASLRGRLRNLDQAQLRVLVDYERAHAGRAAVVTMFERRIAKLASAGD
jgi:hypothetical protein